MFCELAAASFGIAAVFLFPYDFLWGSCAPVSDSQNAAFKAFRRMDAELAAQAEYPGFRNVAEST
jgi:hypothetical protein